MGEWQKHECGKITDNTGAFLGRANNDEEADALCRFHNADLAALTAERDELQRRLEAVVAAIGTEPIIDDAGRVVAIAEGREG